MKKLRTVFVCLFLFASFSAAFAQDSQGKAIIPHWEKYLTSISHVSPTMFLSNISSETVTVKVTLYDENGNVYDESSETGSTNFRIQGAFSGDPMSAAGATLGPNQSGRIIIENGSFQAGYGEITWSTGTANIQVALVAGLRGMYSQLSPDRYARWFVPINDLKPF